MASIHQGDKFSSQRAVPREDQSATDDRVKTPVYSTNLSAFNTSAYPNYFIYQQTPAANGSDCVDDAVVQMTPRLESKRA